MWEWVEDGPELDELRDRMVAPLTAWAGPVKVTRVDKRDI
jgi:hypothetical protein